MQNEILLKDEKSIRRRWLTVFLLLILPTLIADCFDIHNKGVIFSFWLIFHSFFSLLLFYRAYIKRGSFLLGVSTVLYIIYAVQGFCSFLFVSHEVWQNPLFSNNGFGETVWSITSGFIILCILLDIYFVFISYKFYKINKIWREKRNLEMHLENIEQKKRVEEQEKQNKIFSNVP